jgi:hypothetical protein
MKKLGARSSIIVGLGAAAFMLSSIACGSGGGTSGTGGSTATGGAAGKATGGAAGSATGGAGGATGGAGGATGGGAGATAATGGAGGAAGGGGAAGAAGARAPVVSYTFDTSGSTQGFILQTYVDPGAYKDLGALAADAGVPDGGTYPTISQAAGQGQGTPASGALQVTAHFTDYQQYVEVLTPLSAADLSSVTLHAAVEVTTSFDGGAFLYAKSGGSYVYASAVGVPLVSGAFTDLEFDVGSAVAATSGQTFDPTAIEEIGIHIYSNAMPDGGTFAAGEYTFYIDNVVSQ